MTFLIAYEELHKIIKDVQEKSHPIRMEGFYAEPVLVFNARYYDDLKSRVERELSGMMGNPMSAFSVYGYPIIFDPNVAKYKVLFEFPNLAKA